MMLSFFSSLRFRLLLLILLAILPTVGLVLYNSWEDRRDASSNVRSDTLRLTKLAAGNQQALIEGARQLLLALAQLPEVHSGDPAACNALFASMLKQYPLYSTLVVAEPDGDILCSSVPLSGPVNAADRAWFQDAVQTHDFAVGDYQIGRITGKAVVVFGYPVIDEAGEVEAVVGAALDLAWLNQLVAEAQLPEGATFTVIDHNGTILARYPDPEEWVGQAVPEAPIVQAILSQGGEGTAEAEGVDGVTRLYAFTRLGEGPEADAYAAIGIPKATAFAQVNADLVRNLAGLAVVGALALVAAWIVSDAFVLRPVNALVSATKRLRSGDLSTRTGPPYLRAELGQLARAFDEMASSVEQREEERERAVEELIFALAAAVEAKDPTTEGHLQRLPEYAVRLGQALGLGEHDLLLLRYGAILHDIGKISVSEAILSKPGPLTDAEWEEMRQHPIIGQKICAPLRFSQEIGPIVRHHHERWDGMGYVDSLSGEDIPILARLISVVDAFDAMSSDRPYRKALPSDEIIRQFSEGAGKQWDPNVTAVFLDLMRNGSLAPGEDGAAKASVHIPAQT